MPSNAGLTTLPPEIIYSIFQHIRNDEDVFAARLVNSAIEKASFAYFGRRFFRKKGFMITTPSLAVLKQIADHEELSTYVQHVWFNPDCYTFASPACVSAQDELEFAKFTSARVYEPDSDSLQRMPEAYRQMQAFADCVNDHKSYYSGNDDRLAVELTTVFRKLPNLLAVGMRRSEEYSPYGWKELKATFGNDPRVLGGIPSAGTEFGGLSGPTELFIAVVKALASAGVRLQRLYTDALEIDNIVKTALPQQTLDAACAPLLYLEINAILGSSQPLPSNETTRHTVCIPADYGSNLARLLVATPNLREIGMQIFPDRKQRHLIPPTVGNTTEWRLGYPYLALLRIADTVALSHLTRVKLEKITTMATTLQRLLQPSARSLASLKLRDIRFLCAETGSRPWESFFAFLASRCTQLQYILFNHLMYDHGTITFADSAPSAPSNGTGGLFDDLDAELDEFLGDPVPLVYRGQGKFVAYEHITLRQSGREAVRLRLEQVAGQHLYQGPLSSYAMDDGLWDTDTSDEEEDDHEDEQRWTGGEHERQRDTIEEEWSE